MNRYSWLNKIFTIDLRSLALMRIFIGSVLVIDLLERFCEIPLFYSDSGLLPVDSVLANFNYWQLSFHLFNGSVFFQSVLIIFQILLAIFLVIGYKTRLVTFLSFVFYISLFNRNVFVNYGTDFLLLYLLLLGIFLPWQARFSIDSLKSGKLLSDSLLTIPSSVYLVHIIVLYGFSGAFKLNATWLEGNGLFYALTIPPFQKPFAKFLLELPVLVVILNYLTIIIELATPLLLLSPYKNQFFRIFVVISLIILHLGIYLSMDLGLFSFVAIAGLIGLIPYGFWEFLKKLIFLNSSRFKTLKIKSDHSKVSKQNLDRNFLSWFSSIFLILLMTYTIFLNSLYLLKLRSYISFNLEMPFQLLRLTPKWDMFSDVNQNANWLTVVGEYTNGERINLLTRHNLIDIRIPSYDTWLYETHRRNKYAAFLHRGYLLNDLKNYLCHSENSNLTKRLHSVQVFFSNGRAEKQGGLYFISGQKIYMGTCY